MINNVVSRSLNSRPYMNARIELVLSDDLETVNIVKLVSYESEIIVIDLRDYMVSFTETPVNYSRSTIQHVSAFCRDIFHDDIYTYDSLKAMQTFGFSWFDIPATLVDKIRLRCMALYQFGTFHDYTKRKGYKERLYSNIW